MTPAQQILQSATEENRNDYEHAQAYLEIAQKKIAENNSKAAMIFLEKSQRRFNKIKPYLFPETQKERY